MDMNHVVLLEYCSILFATWNYINIRVPCISYMWHSENISKWLERMAVRLEGWVCDNVNLVGHGYFTFCQEKVREFLKLLAVATMTNELEQPIQQRRKGENKKITIPIERLKFVFTNSVCCCVNWSFLCCWPKDDWCTFSLFAQQHWPQLCVRC